MKRLIFILSTVMVMLFAFCTVGYAVNEQFPFNETENVYYDGNNIHINLKTAELTQGQKDYLSTWQSSENNMLYLCQDYVFFLIFDDNFREIANINPYPGLPELRKICIDKSVDKTKQFNFYKFAFMLSNGKVVSNYENYTPISTVFNLRMDGYMLSSTYYEKFGLSDYYKVPLDESYVFANSGQVIITDDGNIFASPIINHSLTVEYKYEDGTTASENATQKLQAGESYNILSPSIAGHTPDKPTVSGSMPDSNLTVSVTYTKNLHTLTINYIYDSGGAAAEPISQSVAYGEAYNILSPTIEGYTPDKPTVSGSMPDIDLTITVTYNNSPYILTIHYAYLGGNKAADSITLPLKPGENYNVDSPLITGYSPDIPHVAGIMENLNMVITVTYVKGVYTLTIHYTHTDGKQAAPDAVSRLEYEFPYSVTSPVLTGYTANTAVVSGAMPDSDLTVAVAYTKNQDIGGGEPGGNPSPSYDPFQKPNDIPHLGDDPFQKPSDVPYAGYNPFLFSYDGGWQGSNPFAPPQMGGYTGYDPFKKEGG